jgi:hypothetical protein
VYSRMGSCQKTCFAPTNEDVASQEDQRVGFSLMTKGETNELYWRAFVVVDPLQIHSYFKAIVECGEDKSLTNRVLRTKYQYSI